MLAAYWTLGGTALLDTVGGYAEDFARAGGSFAVLVGLLIAAGKVVGGLVPLGLTHRGLGRKSRRPLLLAGWLGSGLLILYGGLFVTVGALVLAGILQPDGPVDRGALTWHVLLWDLWFLLWGLALATTTWRSNRSNRSNRSGGQVREVVGDKHDRTMQKSGPERRNWLRRLRTKARLTTVHRYRFQAVR